MKPRLNNLVICSLSTPMLYLCDFKHEFKANEGDSGGY